MSDIIESFFFENENPLCVCDTSGKFLLANNRWQYLFGYSLEDLKNRRFIDLIHPFDKELVKTELDELTFQKKASIFKSYFLHKEEFYHCVEWRIQLQHNWIYIGAREIYEEEKSLIKDYYILRTILKN